MFWDNNFDLTSKNSLLLGNLNPAETTISFHLSQDDANNNVNAIANPLNYSSSASSKTIYARIDNNGIITTNFFDLKVYDLVNFTIVKIDVTCKGMNNGSIIVNPITGKSPYAYKLDDRPFTAYPNNGVNYQRFDNLSPGTHVMQIQDASGCISNPYAVQINEPNLLSANVTVANQNTIIIHATGGSEDYQYSLNGYDFQKTPIFSIVQSGNYIVHVRDSFGCIVETPVVVYPQLAAAADITIINCNNSTALITATATGGSGSYEYSFDNGKTFTSSNTYANVSPGIHNIIVKDSQNNTDSIDIEVKQPAPLVITSEHQNIQCKGNNTGFIKVNATGGQPSYSYSINGGAFSALDNFYDLGAGTYTIIARDMGGCDVMTTVHILEPALPLMTNVTVQDQTIIVNSQGGTGTIVYAISPNLTEFSTNNIFSNLAPGNYDVFAQDQNGCFNLFYVLIDTPAPLFEGKKEIVLEFKSGQTLGDLVLNIPGIKWYSSPGSIAGKSRKTAETTLPSSTVLVNGVTYYASQTINGVESKERLAVTAKVNGSLATDDFELAGFKYSPNPVKNILTLNNAESIDQIEIFSVLGSSVFSKKINAAHSEIDLSGLSSGIYLLKVKSNGKEKTVKIIKQ